MKYKIDMIRNSLAYCLILIIIPTFMMAAIQPPISYSDARVQAMGNTFVAIADDKNMLFFNPAGFATFGLQETSIIEAILDPTQWRPKYSNIGEITIGSVSVGASGLEINDMLILAGLKDGAYSSAVLRLVEDDFFTKIGDGNLTRAEMVAYNDDLIQAYNTSFSAKVDVEVMSMARHYFGFGSFTSVDVQLKLDPTRGFLTLPNIQGNVTADVIFPLGIGIPIPNHRNWSAGITLKYFHRMSIKMENLADYVEVSQWASGDNMNDNLSDYIDKHSYLDIMMNGVEYTTNAIGPVKLGTGYGFDLGFMYRPSFAWKFGLQLSDVYTKINWWDKSEPSRIPMNARVGAAYMPRWSLVGLFEDPIIAMDVEDVLHQQKKNFFLKWHFGSEIKFLFNFAKLRFGINEGYPSYGVGFDLGLHFFSRIPVLKWLRPDRIYFPKFDPKDKEFIQKNPLCCCLTGLLAPLLYGRLKIDLAYVGYELGDRPGDDGSYQFVGRAAFVLAY